MEQEPTPRVVASGAGAIGIGGAVQNSTFETHIDQSQHVHYHGDPLPIPPKRLAYIRFPSLGAKFAGRVKLLDDLSRDLETGRGAGVPRRVAVQAGGGVGKTALAVELGWRLFEQGKFDYVLFLNATSPENLETDLASLSGRDKLNLPEQTEADQKNRRAGVLRWMKSPGNAERTLLILDGADSPEARQAVRELDPQLPGCVLLVTSREKVGGGIDARELELFTDAEAHEFLRSRLDSVHLQKPDAGAMLDGIARAVDRLPLALEIVASYLEVNHESPQEWLREWQAAEVNTLEHTNPEDTSYPVSLSRVWDQSFARLSAPAAWHVQALAWLAPRPAAFPMKPLRERKNWDETRNAFAALERASLIQWPQDTDEIAVHRILQAVMRYRMTAEEKSASLALAVTILNDSVPDPEFDVEGWRLWERLGPHLKALLRRLEGAPQESQAARLMSHYGLWLHRRVQDAEAEPVLRRALEIDERSLGKEHPDVARDLNNLGLLLQETNRLQEAEPLMLRALKIDENIFGPDHPTVAIRLNARGVWLLKNNRFAEAEPLLRRALEITERTEGKEHPRVAIRLNNLAQLLVTTNRAPEAEQMMRRALEIDAKCLGGTHPNVARDLNHLAILLSDTGLVAEALPLARQALEIDEKSYGNEHPKVAMRLNNLGQFLLKAGRVAEAEPLLRRALKIDEKALGKDDPEVATRLYNLGLLLMGDANRLTEAEALIQRAVEIYEKSYGAENPGIAAFRNNLAFIRDHLKAARAGG